MLLHHFIQADMVFLAVEVQKAAFLRLYMSARYVALVSQKTEALAEAFPVVGTFSVTLPWLYSVVLEV